MSFLETIARAKTYLQEHGRVSLRVLKREFELDDEALDELVEELVDVQQVAAREGKTRGAELVFDFVPQANGSQTLLHNFGLFGLVFHAVLLKGKGQITFN